MIRIVVVLCLLGFSLTSSAQKGILKSANKYFEAEIYDEALKLYNQYEKVEKDKKVLFRRGISNYETNHIDDAIRDLTKAFSLGIDDKKIYLHVGRAMHSKGEYKDAVKFYKNYLRYIDDENEKRMVIDAIKRCASGINNQYNEQLAFVENMGSTVNSTYDEIHPVQSPTNQNKYYFSSNRDDANGGRRNKNGLKDEIYGKYRMDMYAVELNDGNWTTVSAFHPLLNSPQNDILMDFNPSGSVMYFLKSKHGESGEMLTDTFVANREEGAYAKVLQSPMISKLEDTDLMVFNENTILFSSKREGGYGGYDLYTATKVDSIWQTPVNLGATVNSPYDELSPFLANNGAKLYFSSNRLESIGGHDIFMVDYMAEGGIWSLPTNLGLPINSTRDDLHFSVSSDGTTGMFSSNRKESEGGHDLYLAYMKNQINEQLMYTEMIPFLQKDTSAVDSIGVAIEQKPVQPAKTVTHIKSREYFNTPLYYGADENILNPNNMGRLDAIYDLLVIYPELNIMLTSHALNEGMTGFDLYFSIKRAQKAADYLIAKGASADRIYLRGLGSNFPLAKEIINGRVSRIAKKNNRRVELSFFNVQRDKLKIANDEPIISANIRDGRGDDYNDIVKGISYKVLIKTVKQMYKGAVLKKYRDAIIEKRADSDLFDYTLGIFANYSGARIFKNQLIREGIQNAEVLVYLDGRRLEDTEIEILQDTHRDLKEYLRYK